MYLLPYERFRLESPEPPAAVAERLARDVGPSGGPFGLLDPFTPARVPYRGRVTEDGFRVRRAIRYRNSFLPVVRGSFARLPAGTVVAVAMRPSWPVLAFTAAAAGFLVRLLFTEGLRGGVGIDPAPFSFSLGGLIFLWLLSLGAFGFEAARARAWLRAAVEGPAGVPPAAPGSPAQSK